MTAPDCLEYLKVLRSLLDSLCDFVNQRLLELRNSVLSAAATPATVVSTSSKGLDEPCALDLQETSNSDLSVAGILGFALESF